MTEELKYSDRLINALKVTPKVQIYPVDANILYDQESGETEEIKYDPLGDIRIKPSQKILKELHSSFNQEVKVNKYKLYNFLIYLKNLHTSFQGIYEEEIKLINKKSFSFRKGIKIYYDYHPVANPNPIKNLDELSEKALQTISSYCTFQKKLIDSILQMLNNYIPDDSEIGSLEEPIKDENDFRIFVNLKPQDIREYFSFLIQETKQNRSIMNEKDFEYFLSKNFQGFPPTSESRELTFELIGNSHLQHIIYNFYRKYGDKKKYDRKRWAKLLNDNFPTKYTGEIKTIASNFRKDSTDSTLHKFEDLGLQLPE